MLAACSAYCSYTAACRVIMGEKGHRSSSHNHHSSSKHRHPERREEKRSSDRSRSPSLSHRRHHREEEDAEETKEERSARKRKERREDERHSKHRRSERDSVRGDSHNHSKKEHLKVIDDNSENDTSRKETFIDSDASRFESSTSNIPTATSLDLKSHPGSSHTANHAPIPKEPATVSSMKRDDWMLTRREDEGDKGGKADDASSSDYFTDLGSYSRTKASKPDKPNPDTLKVSSKEINTQFIQGRHIDEYETTSTTAAAQPGGPGHQWRMMKLKRVYEAAEDEGRDVEEVALERYGSIQAFNEARAERQHLDDQRGRGGADDRQGDQGQQAASRSTQLSLPLSKQIFRKPGEPSTLPSPTPSKRQSSFRQNGYDSKDLSKPSTPIPSVFTPTLSRAGSKLRSIGSDDEAARQGTSNITIEAMSNSQASLSNSNPPLSAAALNKLSAKVMRAEMMGSGDAAELRAQLDIETARAQSGGDQGFGHSKSSHHVGGDIADETSHIQVLPTLDARGRLYDIGKGQPGLYDSASAPGNHRKTAKFETRDFKTGELIRYNADDDDHSLADLVRQERFGAGSADQKNVDAEMAVRITSDQAFKDNIDYMDDNVERLARKKMKTDAMKRQFAVQDFARTKKALDSCQYCWQEEGARPPRATIISSGTRCYLAIPPNEALTLGHCLIVPMQHHLTTLEVDDDSWEEIKNFMKCLMKMAASRKQGVLFYETVKSLKQQRHTFIEAVPVDAGLFSEMPGYFKQSIQTIGDEWSQNKKLIEFSASRPFRRNMVPQLPYFMVQWDYKGEKGYGHVIEDGDGHDGAGGGDGFDLAESSKGGGEFPSYFAAEIIGNLLELEPRRWRKPRKMRGDEQAMQVTSFQKIWKPFDWTVALD